MATFTEKHHFKYLQLEVKDRIATITLNRPEQNNAVDFQLTYELRLVLKEAEGNEEIKVILLKANGNTFSTGADMEHLAMMQNFTFENNLKDSNHLKELYLQMYRYPKMVIVQIEGDATAGGCGLVTVCDFAFSVPTAKFGFDEVKMGFIPALVMYFLIRKVGDTRAKEMLLTGDLIGAEQAVNYGLINRCYEPDAIEQKVQAFATRLCKENSASSMAMTKKMISDLPKLGLEEGLKFAAKMNAHSRGLEDFKKGLDAVLNQNDLEW